MSFYTATNAWADFVLSQATLRYNGLTGLPDVDGSADAVRTETFDLQGRPVRSAHKGLPQTPTTFADGHTTICKKTGEK